MLHFNKEMSLKVLHELTQILIKYNIKYWLQDGTLLGYYREKDLISHDNDTDIGLFWSDIISKDVFLEILNNGFNLFKIKGHIKNSLMLTFLKEGQKVDLFFYYKENEKKIFHTALGKHWQIVKYKYDAFDVKEVNFLGYQFLVPEDELKFITTKYGQDWNIPKPKWDNINGPINAEPTEIFLDIKKCRKEFRSWLKK
jgi:phosphorylcholine metabolism protein LicD